MIEPQDELLSELSKLPAHDAHTATAERVRRVSLETFIEAHETKHHPWRGALSRVARGVTPIVVATTVGVYLTWAVSAANALFP